MKQHSGLLAKTKKFSKSRKFKRQQSIADILGEKKVQYYVLTHHKIKSQLSNGQYKNVCDWMFEMDPPQKSQILLFYSDQLFSVNKLMKYHILRKEVTVDTLAVCFKRGREVLPKLENLFVVEESLQWPLKKVNQSMNKDIAQFLSLLTYFTTECAYVRYKQDKIVEAMLLFDILYKLAQNVVTSSTNNRKLLKKVGQALLTYASFLIDMNCLDKALEVLFLGVKNETNLLLILSYRLKTTSKVVHKRTTSQAYSRLFAIFFNLAYIFQLKKQLTISLLYLNECREISRLKTKLLSKDPNSKMQQFFNYCSQAFTGYGQVSKIVSTYFNVNEIQAEIQMLTYKKRLPSEDGQVSPGSNFVRGNVKIKSQIGLKKKKVLRKSVSLKEKVLSDEVDRCYKNFGHQFLFHGVKLFDKINEKEKKKSVSATTNTSQFLKTNYSQTHHEINNEQPKLAVSKYCKNQKERTTLKKKTKKKNNNFREVQEPVEYEVLKGRFAQMWKQDELAVHRTKEQICLLNYKNHNFGGLYKENKNAHEEITLWNRKPEKRISHKPRDSEVKEVVKETGLNLLKQILIKKSKDLGIKKTQTIAILKKKSSQVNKCILEGGSNPLESVNFLKNQLEVNQERYHHASKPSSSKLEEVLEGINSKGGAVQHIFLTKNAIEIPNLFLSYITQPQINKQFLSIILEYGLSMIKNQNKK